MGCCDVAILLSSIQHRVSVDSDSRAAIPASAFAIETRRSRRATKKPQRASFLLIAKTQERVCVSGRQGPGSTLRCLVAPSWLFVPFVFQSGSSGVREGCGFCVNLRDLWAAAFCDVPIQHPASPSIHPAPTHSLTSSRTRSASPGSIQVIGVPRRSIPRNHVSCRLANRPMAVARSSTIRRRSFRPAR